MSLTKSKTFLPIHKYRVGSSVLPGAKQSFSKTGTELFRLQQGGFARNNFFNRLFNRGNILEQQIRNDYGALKKIPLRKLHVDFADQEDAETLAQLHHNPEYIDPEEGTQIVQYGSITIPKRKMLVNEDPANPRFVSVKHPGHFSTLVNPDGLSQQDIKSKAAEDFATHALRDDPVYDQLNQELESRLVQQYGQEDVRNNGGADAYIRALISDNKEYQPYLEEMSFVPQTLKDKIVNYLKTGKAPRFQEGGTGAVSLRGYQNDSPDRFNAFNIIPSNHITMQDVPHPVWGVDDTGVSQLMLPGNDYRFPGQTVLELPAPMKQLGGGAGFFSPVLNARTLPVSTYVSDAVAPGSLQQQRQYINNQAAKSGTLARPQETVFQTAVDKPNLQELLVRKMQQLQNESIRREQEKLLAETLQKHADDYKKRISGPQPVDNVAPNTGSKRIIEDQLKKVGLELSPQEPVKDEEEQQYQEALFRSAKARKEAELARRKKAIEIADEAQKDPFFSSSRWTKQNLYNAAQGLGERFRFFEDNVDGSGEWIDEHLNPFMAIGKMAQNLGTAPLKAEQTGSIIPYVTAIGVPLFYRYLKSRPFESVIPFAKGVLNARTLGEQGKNIVDNVIIANMRDLLLDEGIEHGKEFIEENHKKNGGTIKMSNSRKPIPRRRRYNGNVYMQWGGVPEYPLFPIGVNYVFPGQEALVYPESFQTGGEQPRLVDKVPSDYHPYGQYQGRPTFAKDSGVSLPLATGHGSGGAQYEQFLVKKLASGVSPEELARKKYIHSSQMERFRQYYKPSRDVVYTRQATPPPPAPVDNPVQGFSGTYLFDPRQHATAEVRYRSRNSTGQGDPGTLNTSQQVAQLMFLDPMGHPDPSKGFYEVPADVFSNQMTGGTHTLRDTTGISQYRVPQGNLSSRFQTGGEQPRLVSAVPQGYRPYGKYQGQPTYVKDMGVNLPMATGTGGQGGQAYDQRMIDEYLSKGVTPEQLAQNKFIHPSQIERFRQYYKPNQDVVYMQPPAPVSPPADYPTQGYFSNDLYFPNKALGAVANYGSRKSTRQSDPGTLNTAMQPAEMMFVDKMGRIDPSRGFYRIPHDVFSNQMTHGTNVLQDTTGLSQYRVPPPGQLSSRFQTGGGYGPFFFRYL